MGLFGHTAVLLRWKASRGRGVFFVFFFRLLLTLSPGIPVVMASGYDQSQVMADNDHAERPQAFLNKPYQIKALHETICKVLEDSQQG